MIVIFVILVTFVQQQLCSVHPYYKGLQMGIGTDSKVNRYFATALNNTDTKIEKYAVGQGTNWKLIQITSSLEMNEALDVSGSGSFKGWGAHVSASAAFAQSSSINKYSTHLMVQVSVENAAENIPRPQLSQEAIEFYNQFGLERFESVYGPEFLGGVISGGMYLGMITIHTRSEQEKQSVTAGVKFSGFGASVNIDMSSEAERVFNERRVEVYGVQVGGQPQSLATTIEDMVEQLREFPTQVIQYPVPILGIFNKYTETIAFDWQGDGVDHTIRNKILQELSVRVSSLKDRRSDLEYVRNNYDEFEQLRSQNKSDNLNQITKEINQIISESSLINEVVLECVSNTSKCVEPSISYTPNYQLPELIDDTVSESVGMAAIYFGDIHKIPYGWKICDGSSYEGITTPDLRGRFPLGELSISTTDSNRVQSAQLESVGDVGGSYIKTLSVSEMPVHSHSMEVNGVHLHDYEDAFWSESFCSGEYSPNQKMGSSSTDHDNRLCLRSDKTSSEGGHTHTLGNAGSGEQFEIVPPYTVVTFICKVK